MRKLNFEFLAVGQNLHSCGYYPHRMEIFTLKENAIVNNIAKCNAIHKDILFTYSAQAAERPIQ